MIESWVFVLVLLFLPDGEFGGPLELRGTARTEQGCKMARSAAIKKLAENLVQHTITECEKSK